LPIRIRDNVFAQTVATNLLFKELPYGCECPHWGYLLKGRMRVKYADHEEVITAEEAYYLAPGPPPDDGRRL
jgi:hypothetical protein